MKQKIPLLTILNLLCGSTLWAQHAQFSNMPFNRITPAGWQRAFLEKQRNGLTGYLDEISEPFNQNIWTGNRSKLKPPFYKRKNGKGEEILCWEPFEQTGYYYDGALRCGLLLQDKFLLDKARKQIYGAIAEASPEGVIGREVPSRWGQVCFFRAFMAEYEATGNTDILDAMRKHYDTDKSRLVTARNIFNIEQLVWLGQQTGDRKYIDKAVACYEDNITRNTKMTNRYPDMISDKRQDVHGVTYFEALKSPIVLYMATGNKKYIDAVRNAFLKIDKYHMLADGMPSSEEGLSENGPLSAHETCDITDYTWTAGYMLKATGEVEWADKIERAVLNGGLGAVTKDFDAHQYLSRMNQVVAAIGSTRSLIHNEAADAYCQRHMPWCCTGQSTRFFPNYVGLQWLRSKEGGLVKALYGPGSCDFDVNGKTVKIREDSFFPFSDEIKIEVTDGNAKFPFSFRVPGWTENPAITVNGKAQPDVKPGEFYVIDRTFKNGDVITLTFPKKVRFVQTEMNGMTIDYGPLLFALPVKAKVEKFLLNKEMWNSTPKDAKDLYGYNMYPMSPWNYVMVLDDEKNNMVQILKNKKTDKLNPWNPENPPLLIELYGTQFPKWEVLYKKYKPYGKSEDEYRILTPPLPARGEMIMVPILCKEPERIALVPYGSTTLRLTVFPYWDARNIPSFKPNQIDYQRKDKSK